MKNQHVNKLGFTMIEILVVMTIIGILATLGIRSFTSSQLKARDLRRKADIANLSKPLEAYFNDYDQYPLGSVGGGIVVDGGTLAWGSEFVDSNDTVYMVQLPKDPLGNQQYYYESDGIKWAVYALLENTLDPSVVLDEDLNPSVYAGTNCGTGLECNYRFTSSNFQ